MLSEVRVWGPRSSAREQRPTLGLAADRGPQTHAVLPGIILAQPSPCAFYSAITSIHRWVAAVVW